MNNRITGIKKRNIDIISIKNEIKKIVLLLFMCFFKYRPLIRNAIELSINK